MRPIHTFSLSNQECGVDKTNRLHLEKKWPTFFWRRPLVLPKLLCRAGFAVARVFRPGDSRSDLKNSPPRKRRATTRRPHLFLAGPVHRCAKGFRSLVLGNRPRCLKRKETLEATSGDGVKFLVTLTLLLHLPGMEPDAKPELFDLKFTQSTDERGPGSCHLIAKMPNMRC
jgi:hypothetical protein